MSRNALTQDIILQVQSSVEDFSFCKDFKTPYETVPATNKKTVGVKDGYKYLTKKSSHASGRKPADSNDVTIQATSSVTLIHHKTK